MTGAGTGRRAEAAGASCSTLDLRQRLVLPLARNAWVQAGQGEADTPIVTLYHRYREVEFDDPRHFAFAEGLPGRTSFTPDDAREWSGLTIEEVISLLSRLIEAGIVQREGNAACPVRHDNQPMPAPLPAPARREARSWMDGDSLMNELTGTELDLAWLEAVVPIFRTGHLFLDNEGRQVGEANVFPAAARIDVPTDWRGCPYPGNRYQAEKPMNASALKAMRQHWRQMMILLQVVRAAYIRRFPAVKGGWTVGHVERLAVSALALPSYMMLRCDEPNPNGTLHPVLSNLFRVVDGLRMVMHQMLFVPKHEAMSLPDRKIDAETILAYADRNFSFHSDHGVCAGPRFMIEDMLGVALDGREPRSGWGQGLDPELIPALNAIEPAIDYAMLGLQTYGVVFSLWPEMAACYERLHRLLSEQDLAENPVASAMAQRFAGHFEALSHRSFLASAEWRTHRIKVYDDMFAAAFAAVNGHSPAWALSAAIAPTAADTGERSREKVERAAAALFGNDHPLLAEVFADLVLDFLLRGQAIVSLTEQVQRQVSALLHRPEPARALTLGDLNLHNVLMGEDVRSVPFLPAELGDLLGLSIDVDARSIRIAPRAKRSAFPDPAARVAG